MRQEKWLVTVDNGPRPAGQPDECFYCRKGIGHEHNADCVLRRRTVIVQIVAEVVIEIPESWDESTINFHKNESSWCKNNLFRDLAEKVEEKNSRCMCKAAEIRYLREASPADHEGVVLADHPWAGPESQGR